MVEVRPGNERFDGQVIIITGANSPLGIGLASAHEFAAHGAHALYLCDFSASHLSAHAARLASLYPSTKVHTRQFDAADEPAVAAVVDDALKEYGRLDVFFANAGVASATPFWDETADGFESMLRTNTLGVFLAFKHGSRGMKVVSKGFSPPSSSSQQSSSFSSSHQSSFSSSASPTASPTTASTTTSAHAKLAPGGVLLATASVAGLRSNAGSTAYSASKAAVINLVQTIAYQLRGTSIRCNAICPGLIETGMTLPTYEAARQKGTEKKIGQLNPLMRGGEAREVARVVRFLAGDGASYVNGQAWAVDGGLSAGLPFVPGKLA